MNISWHGLSCFEIEAKTTSGNVTMIIDPYENTTGLRFPRTLEGQVVAVTHNEEDANNTASVSGDPFIINMPGEYEVKGVFVYGIAADDQTIYRIEAEGINIAHLGALKRELTDAELQQLGDIDILMVPVGGGRVMSPSVAAEVIGSIEPRVVIPMSHGIPNVKEKLATVDEFCKAFGVCRRESSNKYKVTRKDLPEDDMLIMTLER